MKNTLQSEENPQHLSSSPGETQIHGADPAVKDSHLAVPVPIPVDLLQTRLSVEARNYRQATVQLIGSITALGVLVGLALILTMPNPSYKAVSLSVLLLAFTALLLRIQLSPVGRRHRNRVYLLTKHLADDARANGDLKSIGPLIDAWGGPQGMGDRKTRELAVERLIDLLPRLKASDADLLDDSHRERLCQLLGFGVEDPLYKDVMDVFRPGKQSAVDLRVAILQAYEQVGDSKALPLVERLAKREARTAGEKRIRDAALSCLPALQARVGQEQLRNRLLRAADTNDGTDLLVRPAQSEGNVDSEQLLRPVDGNPTRADDP